VVEWDQRGTGKTYASNDREIQRRTMNVAQMEHDTVEVVNYLRNRFHRKKIFVVGHSWGSVLGLWLAHEHAELIYAYVGVGQIINTPQNDKVAYQNALQQARIRQNPEAVKDLESIAPFDPPDVDFRKGSIARRWEAQLLGPPASGADFTDPARLLTDLISSPDYTLVDDYSFIRGQSLSMNVLLPAVSKLDLRQLGSDFRAPVFFFEGKYDPYCIPSLIWDYNQTIRAPQKEFVWFDNSGHFPFFEEPQKFSDELVRRLLPLVTAAQKR
jgi:pimeloyl-ACP methyl ester carboxylesterase